MTRTKKRGRKTLRPTKEKFETLYYREDLSAEEIATIFKVNTQTIYNWASYFRKYESNKSDSNTQLSDKQILNCPTTIKYNKKKERSKIS